MSAFWTFAGEHWFIALLMVWAACTTFAMPFKYAWHAWNRYLRSKNIQAHGYPTAQNMDADGDIVHPEK